MAYPLSKAQTAFAMIALLGASGFMYLRGQTRQAEGPNPGVFIPDLVIGDLLHGNTTRFDAEPGKYIPSILTAVVAGFGALFILGAGAYHAFRSPCRGSDEKQETNVDLQAAAALLAEVVIGLNPGLTVRRSLTQGVTDGGANSEKTPDGTDLEAVSGLRSRLLDSASGGSSDSAGAGQAEVEPLSKLLVDSTASIEDVVRELKAHDRYDSLSQDLYITVLGDAGANRDELVSAFESSRLSTSA